jgi:hypothetical protein
MFSKKNTEVNWSENHTEFVTFAEDCSVYIYVSKSETWVDPQDARMYILRDVDSEQNRLLVVGQEDQVICNFLIQPACGKNIKQLDRNSAIMVWVPSTRYESQTKKKSGFFLTADFSSPETSKTFYDKFKAAVTSQKMRSNKSSSSSSSSYSSYSSTPTISTGPSRPRSVNREIKNNVPEFSVNGYGEEKGEDFNDHNTNSNSTARKTVSIRKGSKSNDPFSSSDVKISFSGENTGPVTFGFGEANMPAPEYKPEKEKKQEKAAETEPKLMFVPQNHKSDNNDDDSGLSGGGGGGGGGLLATDAKAGEDPLARDVMERRLKALYTACAPEKLSKVAGAIKKYGAAGPPGLCAMSMKLEKNYPDHWKHSNPKNIQPTKTSPKKASTSSSSGQSTQKTPEVSFGYNQTADVKFGTDGGDNGTDVFKMGFGTTGGDSGENAIFSVSSFSTGSDATTTFGGIGDNKENPFPSFGDAGGEAPKFGFGDGTLKFDNFQMAPAGEGGGESAFGGDGSAFDGSLNWGDSDVKFGAPAFDSPSAN